MLTDNTQCKNESDIGFVHDMGPEKKILTSIQVVKHKYRTATTCMQTDQQAIYHNPVYRVRTFLRGRASLTQSRTTV